MRLHWEYLSYLFRKLPVLSANEELERGYRDFLQVLDPSARCLAPYPRPPSKYTFVPPLHNQQTARVCWQAGA